MTSREKSNMSTPTMTDLNEKALKFNEDTKATIPLLVAVMNGQILSRKLSLGDAVSISAFFSSALAYEGGLTKEEYLDLAGKNFDAAGGVIRADDPGVVNALIKH